jgi:hypothetical protein
MTGASLQRDRSSIRKQLFYLALHPERRPAVPKYIPSPSEIRPCLRQMQLCLVDPPIVLWLFIYEWLG